MTDGSPSSTPSSASRNGSCSGGHPRRVEGAGDVQRERSNAVLAPDLGGAAQPLARTGEHDLPRGVVVGDPHAGLGRDLRRDLGRAAQKREHAAVAARAPGLVHQRGRAARRAERRPRSSARPRRRAPRARRANARRTRLARVGFLELEERRRGSRGRSPAARSASRRSARSKQSRRAARRQAPRSSGRARSTRSRERATDTPCPGNSTADPLCTRTAPIIAPAPPGTAIRARDHPRTAGQDPPNGGGVVSRSGRGARRAGRRPRGFARRACGRGSQVCSWIVCGERCSASAISRLVEPRADQVEDLAARAAVRAGEASSACGWKTVMPSPDHAHRAGDVGGAPVLGDEARTRRPPSPPRRRSARAADQQHLASRASARAAAGRSRGRTPRR